MYHGLYTSKQFPWLYAASAIALLIIGVNLRQVDLLAVYHSEIASIIVHRHFDLLAVYRCTDEVARHYNNNLYL